MTLAVTEAELVYDLGETVTRFNAEGYEIGLFKNLAVISSDTVIGDITPCDFGGYAGLLPIQSWSAGTIVYTSPRAIATHPTVSWMADGSTVNTVYGYYVVDGAGDLMWAELRTDGGIVFGGIAGMTYTVVPQYTRRSEFHSSP